jgi:hypothetical protein
VSFDRGAFRELTFRKCERGFVLSRYDASNDAKVMFAFDHIQDLADWLVEQYRDPPGPECSKPESERTYAHV